MLATTIDLIRQASRKKLLGSGIIAIGMVLTLILNLPLSLWVNLARESSYKVYSLQWSLVLIIACIFTAILSSRRLSPVNIAKEKLTTIILARLILSILISLIFTSPILIRIFIYNRELLSTNLILALAISTIPIATISLISSGFSLMMPSWLNIILSLIIIILGLAKDLIYFLAANIGGISGKIGAGFIKGVPSLSFLYRAVRYLLFSYSIDRHRLLGELIYLWLLIGFIYLTIQGVNHYHESKNYLSDPRTDSHN